MFAEALTITGTSATVYGDNIQATAEPGEPAHWGYVAENSVWWNWTAPISGYVTIDTSGSDIETVLAVYSGSAVSALTELDSYYGTYGVSFIATAGVTYRIAVDGYNGYTGNIVVNLNETPTVTTTFQQGVNGYTGTVDTMLQQGSTDSEFATWDVIWIEEDPSGDGVRQALIRFDDIFGNGPGQVPVGSQIVSATLSLTTANVTGGPGPGGEFYMMLQPWTATDTWDLWTDGIQPNGYEAYDYPTTEAGTGANTTVVGAGAHSFDLSYDVYYFSLGYYDNNGWVIIPWSGATDAWGIYTSEATTAANRPKLTIVYIP
jgi:hypothetical protein